MSQRVILVLVVCAAIAGSLGLQSLALAVIPGGLGDFDLLVALAASLVAGATVLRGLRSPAGAYLSLVAAGIAGALVGAVLGPVLNALVSLTMHLSPWTLGAILACLSAAAGLLSAIMLTRSGTSDPATVRALAALAALGLATLLPPRLIVFTGELGSITATFSKWASISLTLVCAIGVALLLSPHVSTRVAMPTEQPRQPDASASGR